MKKVLVALMVVGLVTNVQAGWTLLDDFDSYDNSIDTHTTVATGGVWKGVFDGTDSSRVIDLDDGQVLEAIGGTAWRGAKRDLAGTDAALLVGETKTYFWQVSVTSTQPADSTWDYDIVMGLGPEASGIDETNAWQDFSVMPFINNDAAAPYINANAPAEPWWALMSPDTWTNVWLIVNNDAVNPSFDLYYSVGDNAPILVAADADWRNFGPGLDLNAIGFMAAGLPNCWYHVDNIYYADGQVLTNPTSPLYCDAPANGETLVSVIRTDPDNDLVFTVTNPDIVEVDVYLTKNDPNANVLIDSLTSVTPGQYTIDLQTQLETDLSYETTYYWKVVGYEPNNLSGLNDIQVSGPVWSFTTTPESPVILTGVNPAYTAVVAGEPTVVLSVTGINGDFQWYKDGNPISETVGAYTGTMTKTLTIHDVQLADEGYYTCKIFSLAGEDESDPARVMTKRQTSYYDFDSVVVDINDYFVDSIDGYKAYLMQNGPDAGWPTVSDANQLDLPVSFPGVNGYGLLLDNAGDDPNRQYLDIEDGVVDYQDITIMLWAHPKSIRVWARLFEFGTATNNTMFVTPDVGRLWDPRFDIQVNGASQQLTPDLGQDNWIGPGTWHHVVVTLSGNTGRMYVDGVLRATNTGMTHNPTNLGATLNYIGKSQWPNDPGFDGLIDELKIYNYALTTEQIAEEYLAYADPAGYICNLELTALPYDYNDDCRVDLADFAMFAATWLDSHRIYVD